MLLHWYAYISMNTYCYRIYFILLKMVWWAIFNASLIVQIHLAIHEILANKAFTVTDGLISWLFVVAFVHPIYVQIALIQGFLVQLSLWKSVHWLWRYKLNEVCDNLLIRRTFGSHVDMRFYFSYIINSPMDIFDHFRWKIGEFVF